MGLPGGVWRHGRWRRDFAFRPMDGEVELELEEAAESDGPVPARVTLALAAALDRVGGEAASPALVRDLSVADRQYLVRRLATLLGRDGLWLTATCGACGHAFDFHVLQSGLPVKQAAGEGPVAVADTSLGRCRIRLATGADQEVIAGIEDEDEAVRALVARCLLSLGDEEASFDEPPAFTEDDLARIDEALEEVAPEVALRARGRCPECREPNEVWLDPYHALDRPGGALFREVHALATAYHWSEAEILGLARSRRRIYLGLIDQARGMVR